MNTDLVKPLYMKIFSLCPVPYNLLIIFTRNIKFKWTKPYLGFWEQNKKTYFMVNLVYYHIGLRLF